MSAKVTLDSHVDEAMGKAQSAILKALEIIGGKAETYAKAGCSPNGPKGNRFPSELISELRNSISHTIDGLTVKVGSNNQIAAFAELGTSKLYSPPPEWIESGVSPGPHSGLDQWYFYDPKTGEIRIGYPMPPSPFLQPAISGHLDEFKGIIENELQNA